MMNILKQEKFIFRNIFDISFSKILNKLRPKFKFEENVSFFDIISQKIQNLFQKLNVRKLLSEYVTKLADFNIITNLLTFERY